MLSAAEQTVSTLREARGAETHPTLPTPGSRQKKLSQHSAVTCELLGLHHPHPLFYLSNLFTTQCLSSGANNKGRQLSSSQPIREPLPSHTLHTAPPQHLLPQTINNAMLEPHWSRPTPPRPAPAFFTRVQTKPSCRDKHERSHPTRTQTITQPAAVSKGYDPTRRLSCDQTSDIYILFIYFKLLLSCAQDCFCAEETTNPIG